MAISPSEKHREVTNAIATLNERLDGLKHEVGKQNACLTIEQSQHRDHLREIAEIRQSCALNQKSLDDHLKRVETWSGRFWGLVPILIGAVLSLAAGLIVALAKK